MRTQAIRSVEIGLIGLELHGPGEHQLPAEGAKGVELLFAGNLDGFPAGRVMSFGHDIDYAYVHGVLLSAVCIGKKGPKDEGICWAGRFIRGPGDGRMLGDMSIRRLLGASGRAFVVIEPVALDKAFQPL